VRLVYNLANDMEVVVGEDAPQEWQRQAECDNEALNLICEWPYPHERR
jgi:hypothetical protein